MEYSVLMSVYKKEKAEFLKEAIESIQKQSKKTDDFVLVCDGELNESLDKVILDKKEEMGDVLNVIRLKENVGLGKALNLATVSVLTCDTSGIVFMTLESSYVAALV